MTTPENTLIIIKPDYMEKRNSMLQLLEYNGFRITHRKILLFTPEQAAEFYKELEKLDPCFVFKVMSLSKGHSEAIILNKVNAVSDLLTIMTSPSCCHYLNSGLEYKIHASESLRNADKEIRFIFPNVILEPSKKLYFGEYCGRMKLTGLIADGTFDACNSQSVDPKGFLANWLKTNSYVELNSWCEQ